MGGCYGGVRMRTSFRIKYIRATHTDLHQILPLVVTISWMVERLYYVVTTTLHHLYYSLLHFLLVFFLLENMYKKFVYHLYSQRNATFAFSFGIKRIKGKWFVQSFRLLEWKLLIKCRKGK